MPKKISTRCDGSGTNNNLHVSGRLECEQTLSNNPKDEQVISQSGQSNGLKDRASQSPAFEIAKHDVAPSSQEEIGERLIANGSTSSKSGKNSFSGDKLG